MRKFTIKFFLLFFTFYILHFTLYISPVYAQGDNIGKSRINPASPLYFLKSVREILELKFVGTTRVRALRQLEFSTRRLREVKSLSYTSRQDLIEPTIERYLSHLRELAGIVNPRDEDLVAQVSEAIILHMNVLQTVYGQISDPAAKRSIRSAVYRLSEWDQRLIEKLESSNQTSFTQQIAKSLFLGCSFLSKEASSSALNEVERTVFAERADKCYHWIAF